MGTLCQGERERTVFPTSAVDKPHRDDETDSSQHTNRREVLDGVKPVLLQDREGGGVCQGDGGHIERHTQRIEGDEEALRLQFLTEASLQSKPPASQHEAACQQMAEAQHTLRLHILIGNDTHQCGHEDRHDTLDGIEPGDLIAQTCDAEIVTHTSEIGTPHGELQKIHD